MVRVVGFDHVVLRCSDVDASLRFYCDALGLAAERVDEWRRGEVLFPSVRIDATTLIDLFPGEPDGTNLDHLCLVVERTDLQAVAETLEPEREPGNAVLEGRYGAQGVASSIYVHDPDGNVVELRCYD
jgi:catechol 2,3-dioxygenase-like lactoylglutathione lyase family enzyme